MNMKLLLSFLTISLMNAGNDDHMTPDRSTSTARELFSDDGSAVTPIPFDQGMASPKPFTPMNQFTVPVDPTPGMTVSQEQADLFKNTTMFVKAIGQDNMNVLLAKLGDTEAEQDIAWNLLSDTSVEFDDSIKRNYIRLISNYLSKLPNKSIEMYILSGKILELKNSADEVAIKRLKSHIKDYFKKMNYELQSIEIKDKTEGKQLGYVVKVKTHEGKELTYYAKTHSEGTLRDASSASTRAVNYIEPLTYKLLDILGVGPQSHFFGRDIKNFYIMTLDISTNDKMESLGDFLTFGKINESEEKENYLGYLVNYKYDRNQDKNDSDYVKLINEIEGDERSKKFCYEITKMNLLVRIIHMTDLHDNSGNFGFILGDKGQIKELKIVDMHVWPTHHKTDPEDFIKGNTIFVAAKSAPSLSYAFKTRCTKLRLEDAKNVMNNELKDFEKALNEAQNQITPMITKYYMDTEKAGIEIEALEERCKGILENYTQALAKLSTPSS